MITFTFIRSLFVLICMVVGYQLGIVLGVPSSIWGMAGIGIGLVGSLALIIVEVVLGKVSLRGLSAAVFGLIFALILAKFLYGAIDIVPNLDPAVSGSIKLVLMLVLCYFGMVFSMRGRDEFNLIIPYVKFDRQDERDTVFIVDTSVIIDGRILDICETKFIVGRFVIPRFVLKELQQVADSQDALKRVRGRRGLEVLNKLRKNARVSIKIHEEDFPELSGVDEKLVKLAKVLNAKVLTNDYNLNKIAEFQGVTILNINELANAVKPVVLPGEMMEVRIVKEGKEANQGVGYLDDGTMVVVDNGRKHLGNIHRVEVTSVLQTAAGKMIFAKVDGV